LRRTTSDEEEEGVQTQFERKTEKRLLEQKCETLKKIVSVNRKVYDEMCKMLEKAVSESEEGNVPEELEDLYAVARWNYETTARELWDIKCRIKMIVLDEEETS
jgi:hypothetical protein